jgi:hypothetical protein
MATTACKTPLEYGLRRNYSFSGGRDPIPLCPASKPEKTRLCELGEWHRSESAEYLDTTGSQRLARIASIPQEHG